MKLDKEKLPKELVARAFAVAELAHRGQSRRDDVTPYINHAVAVAALMPTDLLKAIAVLHDVPENTKVTLADLAELFPKRVVNAVDALTKRKGEQYLDYVERVNENSLARKVKLADMFCNLRDSPNEKQKRKYFQAFKRLVR
jgi:(p)ppGpp synthase/HD superfamily hydrolase